MYQVLQRHKTNKTKDDMKKTSMTVLACVLALLAVFSCGGNSGNGNNGKDSITFDSIKVDSTLSLGDEEGAPSCHVSLCLTYAKGKNAGFINDSINTLGHIKSRLFFNNAAKADARGSGRLVRGKIHKRIPARLRRNVQGGQRPRGFIQL